MATFLLSSFADEASPLLEEQFEASKHWGFDYIEVRGIDHKNIGEYTPEQAKELARRFQQAGMGISAIGSPCGKIEITQPFEPHLEQMKRTLEVANILGAKRIRMFSFYMPKGQDPQGYRTPVMDRLDQMATACEQAGILCCHENEKGIYGDTLARTLDVLQTFEHRIFGVFDPANFIQCGQDTWQAFEQLKPYLEYVHIKDCKPDGTLVPAGKGAGQISAILRSYSQMEGERFITLEPHLMEFAGFGALEQAGEGGLQNEYTFENNRQAFDYAAACLKTLLQQE